MRQALSEAPRHAVFSHCQEHFGALNDPSEKGGGRQQQARADQSRDHQGLRVLSRIVLHVSMIPFSIQYEKPQVSRLRLGRMAHPGIHAAKIRRSF
jgi:hypothetical protein